MSDVQFIRNVVTRQSQVLYKPHKTRILPLYDIPACFPSLGIS